MFTPAPTSRHNLPVHLPTARMCIVMTSSSGADVNVNGCHSFTDTSGQLTNTYCPATCFFFAFICISTTLFGKYMTAGPKMYFHVDPLLLQYGGVSVLYMQNDP
ncbi:hypothetical protein AX774_g6130 [Zancudomyces culisetae]|uniref:Uncharacterized protein n=1 Tax=Zancudomyces culisetae TaxID=1213189 RepID=A0A1R1PHH8_ZANCU|nr:hypothetical protein AX774_g6130 [Zancudomyces culisetae]|eukprot:OMH80431.1 hypothetical protein AX774_g6130 [Zancudomyces culisetae]